MDAFETSDLLARVRASGAPWLEFLRVEAMSAGLYVLPAGAADGQRPHAEDELYHVVSGRAVLRVGEQDQPVAPGSTVFVAARVPHRFHSITEDLVALVVFAPPESP
jgi:mannose-6-phosphate isomerase-like protein (cupin superfamily)